MQFDQDCFIWSKPAPNLDLNLKPILSLYSNVVQIKNLKKAICKLWAKVCCQRYENCSYSIIMVMVG